MQRKMFTRRDFLRVTAIGGTGLAALGIAGCSSSDSSSSSSASETSSSSSSSTSSSSTVETAQTVDEDIPADQTTNWLCDEKTTLTVCTYDAVNNSYPTVSNDLPFWQWLEEYTNVHIEWEVHSNADYDTVVSTKLAAGEVDTDIINVKNISTAVEAGRSGLLVNMADYMDECTPYAVEYRDTENSYALYQVTETDGGIHCFADTTSPDIGHIVYCYNKEWMDALGLSVPTTLDEFYDVCVAMKEAGDLNGNGAADEIILTSSGISALLSILGNSFGLEVYEDWSAFVADENGVVTDEYTSDNMRECLTFMNKLYEEGILDPSITSTSANDMSEKIAADKVGIFVYYSAFAITYGQLTSLGQEDPYAEVYSIGGPLKGPHGDQYYVYRTKNGGDASGVSTSSNNIELAIKWLDTLAYDPIVTKVRTCGWEGQDYYYDEDGEMQLIYPEDGSTWSIVNYGCGQIVLPYNQTYDQLMNARRNIDWYMEEYQAILDMDCFISPSVPKTAIYTDEEQELIDFSSTDCSSYYKEMRSKFITGDEDIETGWDDYVEMMDRLGLSYWIQAQQSVYDRSQ